jgi:hypothetical protein
MLKTNQVNRNPSEPVYIKLPLPERLPPTTPTTTIPPKIDTSKHTVINLTEETDDEYMRNISPRIVPESEKKILQSEYKLLKSESNESESKDNNKNNNKILQSESKDNNKNNNKILQSESKDNNKILQSESKGGRNKKQKTKNKEQKTKNKKQKTKNKTKQNKTKQNKTK